LLKLNIGNLAYKQQENAKMFNHKMKLQRELLLAKKEMGLLPTEKSQIGPDSAELDSAEQEARRQMPESRQARDQLGNSASEKGFSSKKPKMNAYKKAQEAATEKQKQQQVKKEAFLEKQKEKEQKIQKRLQMTKNLQKKTRRGQPIMKTQIDYLLQKIVDKKL
jgi:rRNA processing